MINYYLRWIFCCILIALSGCATFVIKSNATMQCLQFCDIRVDSCRQHCSNNCATCSLIASDSSALSYSTYVYEKQVQGGYVTRGLNSYRDPLQCRKVTCNCSSDFITCKQNCTGVIQKRLQAVPYCT